MGHDADVQIPPLDGLRVIEGSAFVAAPSGGMTLAQLGADIIRFDQIGGGIDYRRWPLTADGESIYWAGLNKGKRSIAVDLRSDRAKELLTALIADAGTFLTNFPARGWMGHEALAAHRNDLVMLAVTGNRDGSTALDYTVNCAVGYPTATGPVDGTAPINHVPAWDLICVTAALGILAADRHQRTGEGSSMSLALSDVALVAVSVGPRRRSRPSAPNEPVRNDLYGATAHLRDRDGVMIYAVGISPKQWSGLLEATNATAAVAAIEAERSVDFRDEGARFAHRDAITAAVAPWIAAHTIDEVASRFDALGVCWGRYQSFRELVDQDPRCSTESELFRDVDQPNIGTYLTRFTGALAGRFRSSRRAPALGEHTSPSSLKRSACPG